MTNLQIKIIDTHHNNQEVDIEDLTSTSCECLISECEQLISELKDKLYEVDP